MNAALMRKVKRAEEALHQIINICERRSSPVEIIQVAKEGLKT